MAWYFAGAAAGLGARYLLNKHKSAQAIQQVEAAANQITANPITPPLPAEEWFTAPGAFTFGLPRGFREQDVRNFVSPHIRPLLAVQGSNDHEGLWIAVIPQHMSIGIPPERSVWIMVVLSDEFRQFVKQWGGTVAAGPVPIVVGGERAIWSTVDTQEQGQHVRRYSALTTHNGVPYEVLMGGSGLLSNQESAKRYADVFWTAIGSWQWADHIGHQSGGGIAGRAAPSPARGFVDQITHPAAQTTSSTGSSVEASSFPVSGGDSEYQLWEAENAITASKIAAPLPTERPFVVDGQFAFALPSNYDLAPDPIVRAWQSNWDSAPLIAVTDHAATEFTFLMAVFSGPSEQHIFNQIGSHSVWMAVVSGEEFRRTAEREWSCTVTRGPDAILIGGERGLYFGAKSVSNDRVEDRKWSAITIHSNKCYHVMMFVLPHAEARYWDVFWTAIGSWEWRIP